MNTAPIYYRSGSYAQEHGELDQYRETTKICRTCASDVQTIIAARYDGMHLERVAVDEALAIHGAELVGLVLSSTIIYSEWDGRYSPANRAWAYTVKQLEREPGSFLPTIVHTHPAILNGFVTMYREAIA